ncbi:MAG: long-chain fatty acid--CoA ligase [Verrucomicrobia bacterium]|jgi:long-chain acyl-CoA synthetase|nr:long-chain fatty acid--CoA ligase [Verrucomicrobiota bacterium]
MRSTIRELFLESARQRCTGVALRHKQAGTWHTISYEALEQQVRCVSEVLNGLGQRPGAHIAMFFDNEYRWPAVYFGIAAAAFTAVPVDAKLKEQEVAHVLRDSEASVIFTSARSYAIIRDIADQLPALKHVIVLDGQSIIPEEKTRVEYHDFETLITANAGIAATQDAYFEHAVPSASDIASIIYTSGTTGRQKGALLSHGNFCSNVDALMKLIVIRQDDNFLLVLPLHHVFAFTGNLLLPIAAGSEISFVESLRTVGENVREVSPTILIGVPLLLEKMYAKIKAGLKANKMASLLFAIGLRKPVIKGISKSLGGKLRIAVVGGAPSDPAMLRGFMQLGLPVLEGYGLTETAPVLTLNPVDALKPGSIGKPLPNVDLRIEMPNAEGIGEIVVRGPNVMQGYYNNATATEEAIQDGWFFTGDLGYIDDEGFVIITGRQKNLIVNREGKNIYPEEVEAQILTSPYIVECLSLGYKSPNETGEKVGLIVVPDQEAIDAESQKRKHTLSDKEVESLLRIEVKKAARQLAEYKRPRFIQVRTEVFEKTSTSKAKRYLYAITPTEV